MKFYSHEWKAEVLGVTNEAYILIIVFLCFFFTGTIWVLDDADTEWQAIVYIG